MKTSFINNILNSQLVLIKFALKLFVCKCLSFQTHLLLDLRSPLIITLYFESIGMDLVIGELCYKGQSYKGIIRIMMTDFPIIPL